MEICHEFKYMMQDADHACLNSVKKNFPETENLMCFFHVMQNVWKRKNLLGTNYDIVKKDIKDLHMCISKKI